MTQWHQLDNSSWVRLDDPGEPLSATGRVSVASDETPVLARLARGRDVLEIGTGLGIATAVLASLARSVWSVDPDEWVWQAIIPELRAGLQVEWTFSREWPPESTQFSLIFIDGQHSAAQVEFDTREALKRLTRGGTIAWHDWRSSEVRAGAAAGGINLDLVESLDTTHGLGIYWAGGIDGHA